MPTLYITSGTTFTLPADWNPSNNSVECYGGGTPGQGGAGGGGGAYAKSINLNISAGTVVNVHIGSSGNTDTWFNATSVANAVANGTSLSCGSKGASASTGGAGASGCGTVKNSGGNGGASAASGSATGGGGGGACGGPNGAGANGGGAGGSGSAVGGGGGGGANNGSIGSTANINGGNGGNGRGGSGGGLGGTSGGNGGAATANLGGGGGGGGASGAGTTGNAGKGGVGALDDVYADGSHGPGGGGGGGAGAIGSGGGSANSGGKAGGFGGGGGGYGTEQGIPASDGLQTDGLIVVIYTPAAFYPQAPITASARPALAFVRSQVFSTPLTNATPSQDMAWFKQPLDIPVVNPREALFSQYCQTLVPQPNPTPLIKLPFLINQDIIYRPPILEVRQQFPGKAPADFHAALTESADVLSSSVLTLSIGNATLSDIDFVQAAITPLPIPGSAPDIVNRVKLLLPKGWWGFIAPIRDAIIGGLADLASWSYGLQAYAKLQSRLAWATGIWLDIISHDYFGFYLRRRTGESDATFRARIQAELIRERVTRAGTIKAVQDLTGIEPTVFEPWNTGDAGAWDVGTFAWDISGGWGDTILPGQAFLNAPQSGFQGVSNFGGWDTGYLAWDGGIGGWADMSLITGGVTAQDIYDTINKTRPTGVIVWTQLFPPAAPMPLPVQAVLTPSYAPPFMIQTIMPKIPHVSTTMPMAQIGGAFAVNPATPGVAPPWLVVSPPILRPGFLQMWEPQGFGGFQAVNPTDPNKSPPWLNVQPPILRPGFLQMWEPTEYGAGIVSNPVATLAWAEILPVAQPVPGRYSVSTMPPQFGGP